MKILGDRDTEESRLNNWVSLTFRLGIAISLALIIIGLIILFILYAAGDVMPLTKLHYIETAIIISIVMILLLLPPRPRIIISLGSIAIGLTILHVIFRDYDVYIQPLVRLEQLPAAIVISIGILLLLLIPIIQVIIAIVLFSLARDRLFIIISVAVLCFAAISLALVLI